MAPIKKPKQQLQRTYLKEWREYNNLSQEAAASRINVSRSLLSKIENAISPYTQQFMENAAAAYGCDVPDLIIRNPLDRESVWSIQDQLKKADPVTRKQIIDFANFLLKSGTDH
ncbi:helix-turn-helix transcriptional regulator [Rhizobium sp. CG5]|uniref:helix-turn-helix domain-containing protein n=1 Tax=Rhizobium sp. CG5 TaxID=2726076 RepID=UPI002033B317|nr:helix-turn-helix transcriptional regulator [Rhizobium sp. CG5]MCM2472127.1 helix-turn-helix transcriptional regulator [Rhizobium sp. CG5]